MANLCEERSSLKDSSEIVSLPLRPYSQVRTEISTA